MTDHTELDNAILAAIRGGAVTLFDQPYGLPTAAPQETVGGQGALYAMHPSGDGSIVRVGDGTRMSVEEILAALAASQPAGQEADQFEAKVRATPAINIDQQARELLAKECGITPASFTGTLPSAVHAKTALAAIAAALRSMQPEQRAAPDPHDLPRPAAGKRVYLSGAMSGIPDNNFPAFHAWAKRLRANGFDVVSPAEIEESDTWEGYLRTDLRELCTCEAIALIPGWENSKGAHLELHVAHRLGLKVMHLPLRFDLAQHLRRQAEFSARTFGPGARTAGVCDHIRKELLEVEADGGPLSEWVDVIILAFDGAWRCGATPEQIIDAIVAKQTRNELRRWPDWRTADPNKAIEHDRSEDAS